MGWWGVVWWESGVVGGGVVGGGVGLLTSSCSSCFCTSSGTPLTGSALVIPSSVALIHVSSELRERELLFVCSV